MKKIIQILMIAFLTSVTMISCTEEQVIPTQNDGSEGGGSGNGGKP